MATHTLQSLFENYQRRNVESIKTLEYREKIGRWLSEADGFPLGSPSQMDYLEGCLATVNSTKISITKELESFLNYCRVQTHLPFSLSASRDSPMLTLNRQMEIVKLLHEPLSAQRLAERLGVSERTISSDLVRLENGISFLDTTLQLKIKRSRKGLSSVDTQDAQYTSTAHPLVAVLNLTQVFTLLDGLYTLHRQTRNVDNSTYRELATVFYNQLSDYAKTIINYHPHLYHFVSSYQSPAVFVEEKRYLNSVAKQLMYIEKRSIIDKMTATITRHHKGRVTTYHACTNIHYGHNEVSFDSHQGNVICPMKEINAILISNVD